MTIHYFHISIWVCLKIDKHKLHDTHFYISTYNTHQISCFAILIFQIPGVKSFMPKILPSFRLAAQAGLEQRLRRLEGLPAQRHLHPIEQLIDGLVGLRELWLVVQGHPTWETHGGNGKSWERWVLQLELDAGWPESEEEQVGNVKLEEEVTRRSKDW